MSAADAKVVRTLREGFQGVVALETPELLRLRALWLLHWPVSPTALDEAVEGLSAAVAATPDQAGRYVDLAAALAVRADAADRPADLVDALDAANHAVSLDPGSPAALFNLGLILSRLHLVEAAVRAWSRYLEVDSRSPWADEARQHLARILPLHTAVTPGSLPDSIRAAALLSDTARLRALTLLHASEVREHVELVLLPSWCDALRRGQSAADSAVAVADAVVAVLRSSTGDALAYDAVREIQSSSKGAARTIARGLCRFRDGVQLYRRGELRQAALVLVEAEASLRAAHSAIVHWAVYYLALAQYQQVRYGEALVTLQRLTASEALVSYSVVRGSAYMVTGLIHALQGQYGSARSAYSAALDGLDGSGHARLIARAEVELAYTYDRLGLDARAWQARVRALTLAPQIGDPLSRHIVYIEAARASSLHGAHRAAQYFLDEGVRWAERAGSTAALAGALWQRAISRARAGDIASARDDLDSARATGARLPDPSRLVVEADIDLAAAEVEHDVAPEHSLRLAGKALETFERTDYRLKTVRAQLVRAASLVALHDPARAESAFAQALMESERQGSALDDPGERAAFVGQMRPVVEALVTLQGIELQRPGHALALLERMRMAVLGNHGGASMDSAFEPLLASGIQRRLRSDELVVAYASLPGQLLIWGVGSNELLFRTVDVGRAELMSLARRLQRAVRSGTKNQEFHAASRRLFEVGLGPLTTALGKASKVVFVPDGPLHLVPFAALMDASGRYLVESVTISISPSTAAYFRARDRLAHAGASPPRRVVAVGNPNFDQGIISLDQLPGSEREARQVAALYPEAAVLLNADATRRDVLSALSSAQVFHFAGHAVVHDDPRRSHLVLAPASNTSPDGGLLYAREVQGLRLEEVKAVILSACHSGAGQRDPTGGPSSLAAAFVGAGVPSVIASLWVVDDDGAVEFFEKLHGHLIEGATLAEALRSVQVQAITSGAAGSSAPGMWAPFVAIGA